jgi:NADH-quinone oxidoreductase E subunit
MSTIEAIVKATVAKNGSSRENLLPILQEISKEAGFLSEEAMSAVAKALNISRADVYGVATFYSFLDTKPRGLNVIRICKTISCYMHSKDAVVRAIEEKLRIKIGETTPDNKFTLVHTNCIGQCHEGPAMLINDDVYTKLTPEKAISAIEKYI